MSSKKRLSFMPIQLLITLLVLMVSCTGFPIETNILSSPTISTISTRTFTPSPAPTDRPTLTPVPSDTPIPQPEWVTDFAQPVLDAIAGIPPDFEDLFDRRLPAWHLPHFCGDWRLHITDGEMLLTECTTYIEHAYSDVVVEVDAHFTLEVEAEDDPFMGIIVRIPPGGLGGDSCRIWAAAHISCSAGPEFFSGMIPEYPGTQIFHLLVIARGSEFGFYMNGVPTAYFEDDSIAQGYVGLEASSGAYFLRPSVKFDNFRLWDISHLPIPSKSP